MSANDHALETDTDTLAKPVIERHAPTVCKRQRIAGRHGLLTGPDVEPGQFACPGFSH
jgi:hypothetical protein